MLRPQCAFERQSARRVLQFTPVIVASYVLHQSISRVIHGKQLCLLYIYMYIKFNNALLGKFLGCM